MPQRPMHCYLPGCRNPLRLWTRIQGLWYCCEQHYHLDRERREEDPKVAQGVGGPMRCLSCGCRISWIRGVFKYEYCSAYCYNSHGATRPVRTSRPRIRNTRSDGSILRGVFVALIPAVFLAWLKGELILDLFRDSGPSVLPLPDVVSFSKTIPAWTTEELEAWIPSSAATPAWRFDKGGLQVLDTLLFGTVPRATAGKLSCVFSLNDNGRARFLLGSDAGAQECTLLELAMTPVAFTVQPFRRTEKGTISHKSEIRTIARNNKSTPLVEISFSPSMLNVSVNGGTRGWPGLGVGPGHIGLSGREQDGFRVYQTKIDLSA